MKLFCAIAVALLFLGIGVALIYFNHLDIEGSVSMTRAAVYYVGGVILLGIADILSKLEEISKKLNK